MLKVVGPKTYPYISSSINPENFDEDNYWAIFQHMIFILPSEGPFNKIKIIVLHVKFPALSESDVKMAVSISKITLTFK